MNMLNIYVIPKSVAKRVGSQQELLAMAVAGTVWVTVLVDNSESK